MGRNLQYYLLYLFLLLLVVYFSLKNTKFDQSHRRLDHFLETKKIQTIVVFQSSEDSEMRNELCQTFFPPKETEILWNNDWQMVDNSSELYIYSSYLDNRLDRTFIRTISMKKGKQKKKLFCRTWNKTSNSSISEVKEYELWIRKWDFAKSGHYYQPFLLSCCVPKDTLAVSIVSDPCQQPKNVINLTTSASYTLKDFAICLKPLDFEQDSSLQILEWLELQFLLGVDRIFAYIYRMHPDIWKVFRHYEKAGKVVLKNYTLPGKLVNEISFHEQKKNVWQKRRHEMAIYNDCFYKHIHSHKFVVNIDLDEAIVPVIHDSWTDLLNHVSTENQKIFHSASLAAPNVYFFDSFGEAEDSSIPKFMRMLRHVHRSANFTPPGFAQKSFFSTNSTLIVSNHYALQTLNTDFRVLSSIGAHLVHLHHYRKNCPPLMDEECENNYMKFRRKDALLWKFKDKLIQNVQSKIQELNLVPP